MVVGGFIFHECMGQRGCDFWCVFLPIEMNWELVWDEAKITFETRPHHGLWSGILYNNMVLLYGKGNSHSWNVDTLSSSVGAENCHLCKYHTCICFAIVICRTKIQAMFLYNRFFFLIFIFKHILHSSCMVLWRS